MNASKEPVTSQNYYTLEADRQYMSVSQYKAFMKCEAAAIASLAGEWKQPVTTAMMVGSYVDAYFEGTLDAFMAEHPEVVKRDGTLKAEFAHANEIIRRIEADRLFMKYMSGEKQVIKTGPLFDTPWKIKIDSYHPGRMIVDLKCMRSLERVMGRSFVEHWGYDLQMAVYATIEGQRLDTYLAVATKETPVDLEIVEIPAWRRDECLEDIARHMPRILEVKTGHVRPVRCGVCDYCKATKVIIEPIDFELVGLSAKDKEFILKGVI